MIWLMLIEINWNSLDKSAIFMCIRDKNIFWRRRNLLGNQVEVYIYKNALVYCSLIRSSIFKRHHISHRMMCTISVIVVLRDLTMLNTLLLWFKIQHFLQLFTLMSAFLYLVTTK